MNEAAEKSDKRFFIIYNQRTNWYRPQSYHDSSMWRSTWSGEGINGLSISNAIHLSSWTDSWVEPEKIDEVLFNNMLQEKIKNSKFEKKISSDKTLDVGGTLQ